MQQKTRENINILLMQFRLAKEMCEQERSCYLKFSKLRPDQITTHNLVETDFDENSLNGFDAVIIGGTGDFGVHEFRKKYPEKYSSLERTAHACREGNIPVLSVCMQFWAKIFGGEVITDVSRKEVGTITVKLTEEAKDDPLFHDMPESFNAQVGHKDYVSKLPERAVLLAYSNLCPTHAYRVGDKEYTLQFHPELDKQSLIERIEFYQGYAPDNPEEYDALMANIKETPVTTGLLEKWIDRVVLS